MVKGLRYYHTVKSPGVLGGVGVLAGSWSLEKLPPRVLHTEEVINAVIKSKPLLTNQAGTADY